MWLPHIVKVLQYLCVSGVALATHKLRERFKRNRPQADQRGSLSMSLSQHHGIWFWVVSKLYGDLGCIGLSFAICRRHRANTSSWVSPGFCLEEPLGVFVLNLLHYCHAIVRTLP